MRRFKTLVFWIFVVLALGAGAYAYFNLKNNKKPQLNALSVIPDNCLVYLNTKDFFELTKKINSQSLIADKLKLFGDIKTFFDMLSSLDSLLNGEESIRHLVEDNSVHFALYHQKNAWITALNLKQLGKQDAVTEKLSELLNAQKGKADLYAFILNGIPMHFNLSEGVLRLSNRPELIVQSLSKTDKKLEKNPGFLQFTNTFSENSLLSMFVDHSLYAQSTAAKNMDLSYVCKTGFSAGALDVQPSQLKINGYLQPGEEELISLFSDQAAQPSKDLATQLPGDVVAFKAFGFSSYPELRIGFPSNRAHIKYWIKANERGLYNVEDDFNENISGQLIAFETTAPGHHYISVEVNDTLKALDHLQHMSDSVLKQDSLKIYRLNDSLEHSLQLFLPLSAHPTNYALLLNSHVFFADKSEHLLRLMQDFRNGNMLEKNESFIVYKNQNFTDEFNYILYNSPKQISKDIPSFFNFKNSGSENPFENFKHFSICISRYKDVFKYRFHLLHESEIKNKKQHVLWTLKLDSASSMPAAGFVNHVTGENEILIQDDRHVLYLINAKGTVLWKKQLKERILSDIKMVDMFKNRKYQMLFNTKNYLHLIDRNGNYVEPYPVKLPSEACSEISVFDYESTRDYRIFIACKNKMIYNYAIQGSLQEKFASVKTDDEVHLPVQYVKVGLSDYLVAVDKEGKIYTFSRKGAGRIGLRNRTNTNCRNFYTDAGNNTQSTFLVYVDDRNGLINKISFEDVKEIIKLPSETEHGSVTFALIDGNRSMDFILSYDHTLQAYNFTGNLILEKNFDIPLSSGNYYGDESHSVFYTLSEDKTELRVFDQIKSAVKSYKANAMPLVSNLFNDNKKYLIITNGEHLNCVLLN